MLRVRLFVGLAAAFFGAVPASGQSITFWDFTEGTPEFETFYADGLDVALVHNSIRACRDLGLYATASGARDENEVAVGALVRLADGPLLLHVRRLLKALAEDKGFEDNEFAFRMNGINLGMYLRSKRMLERMVVVDARASCRAALGDAEELMNPSPTLE